MLMLFSCECLPAAVIHGQGDAGDLRARCALPAVEVPGETAACGGNMGPIGKTYPARLCGGRNSLGVEAGVAECSTAAWQRCFSLLRLFLELILKAI